MCAFYGIEIFSTPRLKNVTYYMRMDTDSMIREPLCYDPFEVMHVRGRSYGYLAVGADSPTFVEGMWNLVNRYAFEHPSVAEQLYANKWEWPDKSWPNRTIDQEVAQGSFFKGYENNFEIVKLDAFRHPNVMAWLEEIMSVPERVFKWRWGELIFIQLANFCGSHFLTPRGCTDTIRHGTDVLRFSEGYGTIVRDEIQSPRGYQQS
jgi:mannosyltransferase